MQKKKAIISVALSAALLGALAVPNLYASESNEPNAIQNATLNKSDFVETSFGPSQIITPEKEAWSIQNAIEVTPEPNAKK